MNKKKGIRKFGRVTSQRKALMAGLITELFLHGKIKTTESKAKEMKKKAEKYITKAKVGDLSARRHLVRYLSEKVVKKLIEEIAPKYKTRPGGYTRIIKLNPRISDGARVVIIELVDMTVDLVS